MMRLLAVFLLAGCFAARAEGDGMVQVSVAGTSIATRLCLPSGGATRPLVLINYGSLEALVLASGQFGARSRPPMLWVYTANDSHLGPELGARMHQAFTATGWNARLAALGAYRQDARSSFFSQGGVSVWGPLIQEFVR